ncbi:MAG: DUF3365 domain-containing protein [Bdellovibrionia bacterium]
MKSGRDIIGNLHQQQKGIYMKTVLFAILLISTPSFAGKEAEGEKAATAVLKGIRGKLTEEMAKNLVNSVGYCHENAIVLTEKFWQEYPRVTSVKRTSLKIRNGKNQPDERELKVLKEWQKLKDGGKPLPPFVFEEISTNEVRYYKPLTVEKMCLTCHGQPTGDLAKAIQTKYPQDKAIGYKDGEFRGLIRVSFKPETF